MTGLSLRGTAAGCVLNLRVQPGARLNAITGLHDGSLKVSVTAPAAVGRANEAVLKLLAGDLGVPRSRLRLASGAANRSRPSRSRG